MEEHLTDTESAYERVLLVGVDDGSAEVDFEGSM